MTTKSIKSSTSARAANNPASAFDESATADVSADVSDRLTVRASTDAELPDDTASAEHAAAIAPEPLEETVTSIGAAPSDEEKALWHQETLNVTGKLAALNARSHRAAQQALAMVYLATLLNDRTFYLALLAEKGTGEPTHSSSDAPAIAFYFNYDVKHLDAEEARRASKSIYRYCRALAALRVKVQTHLSAAGGTARLAFNEAGVRWLISLIEDAGGIDKLANSPADSDGVKSDRIVLDPEEHELRRSELIRDQFQTRTNEPVNELAVAIVSGTGESRRVLEVITPHPDVRAALLASVRVGDPRILALGELLHVGQVVQEQTTPVLVDDRDDPADRSSRRRKASRLIVFCPDHSVIVGNILADAGIVVIVSPAQPILDLALTEYGALDTKGRRLAEINLLELERRSAFEIEMGSIQGTQALARVVITTPVAKAAADRNKSVGFLVNPARGTAPLTVDEAAFKPKGAARVGQHSWRLLIADYALKLQKIKKPGAVTMEIGRNRVSMIDIAGRYDVDASGPGSLASVSIRAEDFISLASNLFTVATRDEVEIALADGLVRFEVATDRARYRVYVPTLRTDGTRSDKLMKKLDVKPWPERQAD